MGDRVATKHSGRVTNYGAVASHLRDALRSGHYGDGDQLPTEAELALSYGVSRQTVRRAMQELVSEGLIYRVAGRGTYPVDQSNRYLRHLGSIEDLMSLSVDTECVIINPLRRIADVTSAGRLRLDSDDVYTVSFIRQLGDVPFCHTLVALPLDIGRALEQIPELATAGTRSRVTVIGLIDDLLGQPISEAEQSVTASSASLETATHLLCPPDSPVLRIDRLYVNVANRPLELAVSHFDPQRYSYRVRLRRHPR